MNKDFLIDENYVEQIDGMQTDYPYCMHTRDLSDVMIPWHWHEELELGYIREGTSRIITLDGEYEIHQGDGFFINSNVMDMKKNPNPGTRVIEINHLFHPVFLGGHFQSRIHRKYLAPIINNRSISVHIIRRGRPTADKLLHTLQKLSALQEQENTELETRSLLSEAWLLLMEDIKNHHSMASAMLIDAKERLQSMIAFIHRNFDQKITAAQIAGAANVSQREAVRIFQKNIGMSPIEYLLSYRLNESVKYLSGTDLAITQISYLCGFSDSTYFGKVFKGSYGITPSDYRKRVRQI